MSEPRHLVPALTLALCTAGAAAADEVSSPLTDLASVNFTFRPSQETQPEIPEPAPAFGAEGSRRLNVHGGWGVDVKDSNEQHGLAGVGVSWFIAENLSLDFELNGIYFDQPGADGLGINFNILVRWHFYTQDTWSLYVDGGAGLLGTTEDVPPGGSPFNFTPQAGVGVSFDVASENRMLIGARWHHVSNANLSDSNPGRDAIMIYVGLSMPF